MVNDTKVVRISLVAWKAAKIEATKRNIALAKWLEEAIKEKIEGKETKNA
jgi:predicted HicB family RNase H-like nuclease